MEVAKLAAPPNLKVRFVSCNESAIKRWLSSELEETVFSLTHELFMTKHHTVTLRIKLLPTFSYISVVVSVSLGRFSQNRSHMYYASTHQNILALQTSHNSSFIMLYESISCMFLQYSVKIFIFSTASNTFQCASFLFCRLELLVIR